MVFLRVGISFGMYRLNMYCARPKKKHPFQTQNISCVLIDTAVNVYNTDICFSQTSFLSLCFSFPLAVWKPKNYWENKHDVL